LFTDGSVHVQSGIGYGAYLLVDNMETPPDLLKNQVEIVRFEQTSSTKLELQTLLYAFSRIPKSDGKIEIYSDSQNILGLLQRRKRLEENDFYSKGNRLFNNAELYREFFKIIDHFQCEFIKVKGHKKTNQKDEIERIFTLVDRASRSALRKELQNQ
jgi:ribonuclease HI